MSPAGYSGIYYVAQPDLEPSFLLPQLTDTHYNALLLISKYVYCFPFFFFLRRSLSMIAQVSPNLWPVSCFSFLSAGITSQSYH